LGNDDRWKVSKEVVVVKGRVMILMLNRALTVDLDKEKR
jgi:hypothetical protein